MKRPDLLPYAALVLLLLACVVFFIWAWQAAAKRDAVPFRGEMMDKMMRQKEQAAAAIERGINQTDYRRIEAGIVRLRELAIAADWYAAEALYRRHSEDFRKSLDQLDRSAQERDIEATRRSYAELRVTCTNCHDLNRRS